MNTNHQYALSWNGIEILISYNSDFSVAFKANMGEALAHIEVKADEPLPISETGYRGLFLPIPEVEEEGGAEELVEKWLDEAADSKKWKEYVNGKRQYSLF